MNFTYNGVLLAAAGQDSSDYAQRPNLPTQVNSGHRRAFRCAACRNEVAVSHDAAIDNKFFDIPAVGDAQAIGG